MSTNHLDSQTKLEYLGNGYTRQKYLHKNGNSTTDNFEISLINIIIQYLGNILITFDCYPQGFQSQIIENGQAVKAYSKINATPICIGCSTEWNEGIHQISFRSNSLGHVGDVFGINSNIREFTNQPGWYTDRTELAKSQTYSWNVYVNNLYCHPKTSDALFQYAVTSDLDYKEGDILSLLFNGNDWTISYLLNGKIVGKPFKITPNLKYSPFICSYWSTRNDDKVAEYLILSD